MMLHCHYSAFQNYQEIGQRDKAKQCLRYVIVANLLAGGEQVTNNTA
jgi:hypothetical protein